MFRRAVFLTAGALAIALLTPAGARAQLVFESVGIRALGMAGAFVAVADDASAAYWNPAGLVVGSPLGTTIEWNRFQTGNQKAPPGPVCSWGRRSIICAGASRQAHLAARQSRTPWIRAWASTVPARTISILILG